jgi:hypothetical protein
MIEGVGEALIRRPPEAIIAFVTDLERYKTADLKIGRVLETRRAGDRIFMRHDGTLRGVPGPAVSLEMTVAGLSVRYRSVPSFPSRLVLTFDGGFELTPGPDGTRVVHTERFRFYFPWRMIAEPFLRGWLAADVRAEMERLKALLEAEAPGVRRPP